MPSVWGSSWGSPTRKWAGFGGLGRIRPVQRARARRTGTAPPHHARRKDATLAGALASSGRQFGTRRRATLTLALLALIPLSGGCGGHGETPKSDSSSGAAGTPCRSGREVASPGRAPRAHRVSRIVVVLMENKECGEVVGNPSAPYLNALARRYALAVNAYAIRHPSFPITSRLQAARRSGTPGTAGSASCTRRASSTNSRRLGFRRR